MRQQPLRPDHLTATPHGDGVDRAVSAARRVVAALLHAGDRTAVEMGALASQLTAVADHLESHAGAVDDRLVDMWAGEGVARHDPVTGPENAVAPPLHLSGSDDGSIGGTVSLGLPYQGPPGCVHGGVSALLLDHTLGVANHWAGPSGMTARLTVDYHRTVPLFEELVVTARQVSVEGRKIHTTGEIRSGGEVCVSATGLFIHQELVRPR